MATSATTSERPYLWTGAVLAVAAPFLVILSVTLWRTAFPIREAVALFEDVVRQPASGFLIPERPYYRPLFYVTLSTIWNHAGSLDATLMWVRLLHIVPVVLLVVLFIWHLRPRTLLDAAAAALAVAVLVGSRGFRDNLEIPLSYTIVGMPLALIAWMLLNRERRPWHAPVIVALTVVAIGFKEQGLVIVPVILAAWWTRAPGATRAVAISAATIGIGYVALRLSGHASLPLFEQAIGLGFTEIEPREATARFGAFPWWIYAYTSASTIGNVLFSEPTRGVFRITHDLVEGHPEIWEMIQLLSSGALTMLIAWWGIRAVRQAGEAWSADARVFVVCVVALVACGALSFDYSRDRLGGMAVPFYALAAFFAVREASRRALTARRARYLLATTGLVLLAAAWQTRTVTTIEIARIFAGRNQMEWLVMLPDRRIEFAERPVYLDIMQKMIPQGTAPGAAQPTRYPRWVSRTLGLQ